VATPASPRDSTGITEDSSLPEAPTADDIAGPAEDSVSGEVYSPVFWRVYPAPGGVDAVTGVAVAAPYTVTAAAVAGDVYPAPGGVDDAIEAYSDPDGVHEAARVGDRATTDDKDIGGGGGGDDDF